MTITVQLLHNLVAGDVLGHGDKDVEVRMERGDQMSSLEINIDLPGAASSKAS